MCHVCWWDVYCTLVVFVSVFALVVVFVSRVLVAEHVCTALASSLLLFADLRERERERERKRVCMFVCV